MHGGFFLSLILHGTLLALALLSLTQSSSRPKPPEIVPVEVALVSEDDIVRLRKGVRDSKKLETRPEKSQDEPRPEEAPKVRKAAAPPPAVTPPPPPPDPPPEKKPAEADDIASKLAALEKTKAAEEAARKKAEEAARKDAEEAAARAKAEAEAARREEEKRKAAEEAKRRAEENRKAEEKRKAEERRRARIAAEKRRKQRQRELAERRRKEREKKQFDADRISALLNKIPDAKAPPSGSEPRPDAKRDLPRGPAAGAPEGRDTRLTASQRSLLGVMMKKAVSDCWRVQTGMVGAEQLVVDVEVRLKPDGSLDGEPRVVNRRPGAHFADAATNAIRALRQCAPYTVLPQNLYKGGWDHMVVTFDPQRMF